MEYTSQQFADDVKKVFEPFFEAYELKYFDAPLSSGESPYFQLKCNKYHFRFGFEMKVVDLINYYREGLVMNQLERIKLKFISELPESKQIPPYGIHPDSMI